MNEGESRLLLQNTKGWRDSSLIVIINLRQLFNCKHADLGACQMISLKDILGKQTDLNPLTYRDRLQLAVYTAASVLQLYDTPWMPNAPTSAHVFFPVWEGCPQYSYAFIVASGRSEPNAVKPPPVIRNPTLLALGVLLIEIIRGQTIDTLRSPDEKITYGLSTFLSDYITARRLLAEIYQASSNYGSAVRRCIDGEFPREILDLDNADFRQEVYAGVVALLEEDLSHT